MFCSNLASNSPKLGKFNKIWQANCEATRKTAELT